VHGSSLAQWPGRLDELEAAVADDLAESGQRRLRGGAGLGEQEALGVAAAGSLQLRELLDVLDALGDRDFQVVSS